MKMRTLLVFGVVAASAWWLWPNGSTAQDGGDTVVNQVWIEKIPESMRGKIDLFVIQDDPEFGIFQRTSAFEGNYTVFSYVPRGDNTFALTLLQSGHRRTVKARVRRKDCREFDLCMTLEGAPRGSTLYFSMDDWVIDGTMSPDKIRGFIRARILKDKLR